jgi:protein-S-isoprenylcysteine O-methyltransferase Ste14
MMRHLLAILALPFVVVVVVPTLLVWAGREWDVRWRLESPAAPLLWGLGLAIWLVGLLLTAWCIRLFARVGQGTLAPWDPTRRLVVVGPYRYVRNR